MYVWSIKLYPWTRDCSSDYKNIHVVWSNGSEWSLIFIALEGAVGPSKLTEKQRKYYLQILNQMGSKLLSERVWLFRIFGLVFLAF